jgi:antitoxin (DNA-binding transcriptional repressor) of toxin-antitoxin stability system
MKTYGIRELRDHLSEAVEESQRSAIVLLKHGKPIAVTGASKATRSTT